MLAGGSVYDIVHEISMIFKDNPFYMNIFIIFRIRFLGFVTTAIFMAAAMLS